MGSERKVVPLQDQGEKVEDAAFEDVARKALTVVKSKLGSTNVMEQEALRQALDTLVCLGYGHPWRHEMEEE